MDNTKKRTYPKYETCDLMHDGVCVSTPCICKRMNSGTLKTDTWCTVSNSECWSTECFLNGCTMKKQKSKTKKSQ